MTCGPVHLQVKMKSLKGKLGVTHLLTPQLPQREFFFPFSDSALFFCLKFVLFCGGGCKDRERADGVGRWAGSGWMM